MQPQKNCKNYYKSKKIIYNKKVFDKLKMIMYNNCEN